MARLANYTEKWFFIHLFISRFFIIIVILVWFWFWFLVFYFYLTERKGLFIYLWKKKRIEMETGY